MKPIDPWAEVPKKSIAELIPQIEAEVKKGILPQSTLDDLRERLKSKSQLELKRFITADPNMQYIKNSIEKVADAADPVLLIGSTGTGKELLAKALHNERTGPFVSVNCAGLPEGLIESELFGHVKGSFTGAVMDKRGLMEEANGGTIFLDEIGELPLHTQGKLLRAIQEKEIRRVGANQHIKIDCRIVSATNKDLHKLAREDKFRMDLYQRISIIEFYIPDLRERSDDILLLLKYLDVENKIKSPQNWVKRLLEHESKLDGNVRSLQKYVRRYYLLGIEP